jgi:hypothetical protein
VQLDEVRHLLGQGLCCSGELFVGSTARQPSALPNHQLVLEEAHTASEARNDLDTRGSSHHERPEWYRNRLAKALYLRSSSTGCLAIQLKCGDPPAPYVLQQRQGVERVLTDVCHAHAVPCADLVVELARASVRLR